MTDFEGDDDTFPRWTCPKCGQHTVVRVLFGMPAPVMFEAAERGDIELGGCCIDGDYTGREVVCTECGWQGNHSRNGAKVTAARRRQRFD